MPECKLLLDSAVGIVFGELGPLLIQEVFGFDTLSFGASSVYSLRNAVTGLAMADRMVRMLIVSRAKPIMAAPARGKIH